MGVRREKPLINKSLILLKVIVFFVISGITALHVLHATKPQLLGLKFSEIRTITIIAPFVSIIGPLIAGPLADRFAAKNANNFGRILRYLTALFLVLSVIIYACLFAIPEVYREGAHRPLVSFGCDANGAIIFQQRCSKNATCHHWDEKVGNLNLTNCTYTCQDPKHYENLYSPWLENVPTPSPSTEHSSEFDYEDDAPVAVTESLRSRPAAYLRDIASAEFGGEQLSAEDQRAAQLRVKRQTKGAPEKVYVKPPHLCTTERDEQGGVVVKNCHVYTNDTSHIVVHSVLRAATNAENDTHSDEWCSYPLDGFQCQIPMKQRKYMMELRNDTGCTPIVECQVVNPYDSKGSALKNSECIIGDLDTTLSGYTVVRLLGDIFPMAALTLLNTAIVIAVRETSEQRGEVCRQYVWGAIGYVLLFSPLDLLFFSSDSKDTAHDAALVALILFIICFLVAAFVLLFAHQIPLSPPEWWWHTKTGMLVYPMSAIRRYSPEIILLVVISILFGTFWSSIHSYLSHTFTDESAVTYAGILLVLALIFNVDKFIEYCGHSNIFIAGFAFFIIRFTALSGQQTRWLTIVMEVLEPTIIGVIWITLILYMRHAMPRKFTATGQALVVLAFFGLGKGLGALIGLARDERQTHPTDQDNLEYERNEQAINEWLAIASCLIALVYFVAYNLILAPRCAAKPQHVDELMSGSASQNFAGNAAGSSGGAGGTGGGSGNGNTASGGAALNGNGSSNYSPLRVYHNERGKKGQFRY